MEHYISMKEITDKEYFDFLREKKSVEIGNITISLEKVHRIESWSPGDFSLEKTTVWSFKDRGKWATHIGNYRGNFSPYIPRNLILKYTQEEDTILDQMMGSGTTLIEAKLLNRNAVGVDINIEAVILARHRLNFFYSPLFSKQPTIKTFIGDARNLDKIQDNTIDLIITHPPYANIIKYSVKNKVEGNLSLLTLENYLKAMRVVSKESFRVLKPGKLCCILIGDTRRNKKYIPLSFKIMEIFLKEGFILREDIIKVQWNMKTTREKWISKNNDFYLIAHEHLFILEKPQNNKEYSKHKYSSIHLFNLE